MCSLKTNNHSYRPDPRGRGKRKRVKVVEEEKLTIVILANGDEDPIWFGVLTSLQGPGMVVLTWVPMVLADVEFRTCTYYPCSRRNYPL